MDIERKDPNCLRCGSHDFVDRPYRLPRMGTLVQLVCCAGCHGVVGVVRDGNALDALTTPFRQPVDWVPAQPPPKG